MKQEAEQESNGKYESFLKKSSSSIINLITSDPSFDSYNTKLVKQYSDHNVAYLISVLSGSSSDFQKYMFRQPSVRKKIELSYINEKSSSADMVKFTSLPWSKDLVSNFLNSMGGKTKVLDHLAEFFKQDTLAGKARHIKNFIHNVDNKYFTGFKGNVYEPLAKALVYGQRSYMYATKKTIDDVDYLFNTFLKTQPDFLSKIIESHLFIGKGIKLHLKLFGKLDSRDANERMGASDFAKISKAFISTIEN
jgi:hypothetical protein